MQCVIIDDSNLISHMIKSGLTPYGYSIDHFKSKDYDPTVFNYSQYKLFIVNKSISSFEGVRVVEDIRKRTKDSYIIGIMTKGDWRERIDYLNAGVDDVLNYPFPMQELVVRVQNITSRKHKRIGKKYKIGNATLDSDLRSVMLFEKPIHLRKKEFGILEYLARNSSRAVSRSELLDNLWDYRRINSSNTIDVHISNIRKKLEGEEIIRTVHGFGYRIIDSSEMEK